MRSARSDTLVQPARRPRDGGAAAEDALVLGRYRLLERLGSGGFGVVWRARDERLGREVAVKRLALARGREERATREALAAARLAHPAVVALYEAAAEGDSFFLVSELVHGDTLAGLVASDALSDERALRIGVALCDALGHAHARGVVHRDVKPANVLVPDDPGPHEAPAKLTDFGGARVAGEEALTATGDVLGTLAYMAPEQADGAAVSELTDLYSCALVLFEALSGTNPVRGATPAATARRLGRPLPSLAEYRGDLPAAAIDALDMALEPQPARRGTLAELRHGLLDGLEELDRPRPRAHWRRTGGRGRLPALPEWEEFRDAERDPSAELGARRSDRPRPGPPLVASADPERAPSPRRESPLVRMAAGAGAGALVAVGLATLAAAPAAMVAVAALVATVAVALWPRLGWLAATTATCAWLAAAGAAGSALVVAAAALPVLLVPPPPGLAAPLPALAPLLGVVGLAGAFPALAGQLSGWSRRGAVGALGYWWLALAGPLLHRRVWLDLPASSAAPWSSSLSAAATHAVAAVCTLGLVAGLLTWAAAAVVLPWIVRGRRLGLDLVAAALWSTALVASAPLLLRGRPAGTADAPRGLLLGAVLGAVLALVARATADRS